MSTLKKYKTVNVFDAATKRISYIFDNFEKIYLSFSAGKDSTVMLHLVMDEARRRNRKIGLLLVDLEAQYKMTMDHAMECIKTYKDYTEVYWVSLPIALRNAVSNFDPKWTCFDPEKQDDWVRNPPEIAITDPNYFPFFRQGMEFEEFVPEFGEWYSEGKTCACFVGIRTDESLNRFRTLASKSKITHGNQQYTTLVTDNVYNVYPIYDWAVSDIWLYHHLNPTRQYNIIYDYMYKAGLTPSQMRICQPYGDDQRRGLWLYHILEPLTWYKVVARVNGVNSGAMYVQENGNIMGYNKITKPEGHTWKSFCELLLGSLPENTRVHYMKRFKSFMKGWEGRGYIGGIPDEAPVVLENKHWAPSWRRLCKVLLRSDYFCKGLGLTQPRSEAYGEYLKMKGRHPDQKKGKKNGSDE